MIPLSVISQKSYSRTVYRVNVIEPVDEMTPAGKATLKPLACSRRVVVKCKALSTEYDKWIFGFCVDNSE